MFPRNMPLILSSINADHKFLTAPFSLLVSRFSKALKLRNGNIITRPTTLTMSIRFGWRTPSQLARWNMKWKATTVCWQHIMITMSWTISPSKSGNLAYRCSSCLQVLLPLDMFMLFNIFCFYTFCWTSSSELYRWTVLTRFSKLIIPLSFDIFISYCLRPAFLYPEYKESMHSGRWAHRPNLTRSSVACSDREYFYSPPGWVASPSQGYAQQ